MALQKKKRNIILKFLWKKSQLKTLSKRNLNFIFKISNFIFFNSKNVLLSKFSKFSEIFYLTFNSKFSLFYLFKKINWLNVFCNDYRLIKFNLNFINSSRLILFLINFHDNILRDSSQIYRKKNLFIKKFLMFKDYKDLSIILLKIKRIFKYFYIFIDYFSISIFNYYIMFYNYFKSLNTSKLHLNNFLVYLKINFQSSKFNHFYFDYLLFNKILKRNRSLYYSINKKIGKFFHRITYAKSRQKYEISIQTLEGLKNKFFFYFSFFKMVLRLDSVKLINTNTLYKYINFLNFNLLNFRRNILYPKFLINKISLKRFFFKNKTQIPVIFLYKKNVNYFADEESADFYAISHINSWDYSIINIFSANYLFWNFDDFIEQRYLIFQNHFFSELSWSWHIVFSKKNNKLVNNIKFFNVKKFNIKFIYFFFKIYKLRMLLIYLIFFCYR